MSALPGWPLNDLRIGPGLPDGWAVREDEDHLYLVHGERVMATFSAHAPADALLRGIDLCLRFHGFSPSGERQAAADLGAVLSDALEKYGHSRPDLVLSVLVEAVAVAIFMGTRDAQAATLVVGRISVDVLRRLRDLHGARELETRWTVNPN